MVYFIRAIGTDHYKVGTSTNVDARLRALQTGSHVKLEIVYQIEGDETTERDWHRRLDIAGYHLHDEWYELPPEVIKTLFTNVPGKEQSNEQLVRCYREGNHLNRICTNYVRPLRRDDQEAVSRGQDVLLARRENRLLAPGEHQFILVRDQYRLRRQDDRWAGLQGFGRSLPEQCSDITTDDTDNAQREPDCVQ